MRLRLDEMLSPAISRELRERGHDVLAVAGHPGWVALSDPEVTALARTERRAVVTSNLRDYRPLDAEAITPGGPGHFGMIFMPGTYRRTKQDTGRIIAALEAKLTELRDLFGRVFLLRIDERTQEARLAARDALNPPGRSEAGRQEIRQGRAVFETQMLKAGAIPLDGTAPTAVIASELLALAIAT